MMVLVSDSSVLIDLERGGLLEVAFQCGIVMLVPDLLFENELRESNGLYLMQLGLSVTTLNSDEVQQAQDLKGERTALSLEDCFALICAGRPGHDLLSGDGPLRKEATARGITCRGLLWLLDEIYVSNKISKAALCEALTKIVNDARCRLPKNEANIRLKRWC